MPRRFHNDDELLPPASLTRRLAAILYDSLIALAVLMVTAWLYTLAAASLVGFDHYEAMAEAGTLESDPLLSSFLFVTLFLFFGYFWVRSGQTLGMQVWRIRVQTMNGLSISWVQALKRYMLAALTFFAVLICAFYFGALSLLLTLPLLIACFWPRNGLSLIDQFSGTYVARVPNQRAS
ncbi:RDD family protein [Marinobacter sp. X15-166B]|uniref:RDD family protein n=1 Tax=Marinobacter sp. X15-166B TaxID=1897620 RepID=UPI00085C7380|nr:RDD family protein [Marinobacter sp. X15-166B]OEY67783.1 hypothetical protein BG841_16025 [Marinobacter sp. X15-166B]